MYMSYCRFEGTHHELRACLSDVDEHLMEEAEYPVSENEIDHFRDMVTEFFDWMQENELIPDDCEINEEQLAGICRAMQESNKKEEDETW